MNDKIKERIMNKKNASKENFKKGTRIGLKKDETLIERQVCRKGWAKKDIKKQI